MPSGPPELHEKFCAMDADGCGDLAAQLVLRNGGYVLTRRWEWFHPLDKAPTNLERDAVVYLIEEWDFGGLIGAAEATHDTGGGG